MDAVQVQVRFKITDPDTGLEFNDALYFSLDDYAHIKKKDIDTAKQVRFVAWKQTRANAALIPAPDPIDVIANMQDQISDLRVQHDDAIVNYASEVGVSIGEVEAQVNSKVLENQADITDEISFPSVAGD